MAKQDSVTASAAPSGYPAQPLVWDGDVIRFRANRIVRFLLDAGPFDMNQLAVMPFDREEYEQFAQLIGYSVSGFDDLSYASKEAIAAADIKADRMVQERQAG